MMKTFAEAQELLFSHVQSASLRGHCQAVSAAMGWYADFYKLSAEEKLLWEITGLLHDFDYEEHPEPVAPEGHPFWGVNKLRELGYPEEMLEAILGHADYSGVARTTQLAKTLFAVDELSGLVVASVYVRPDKSIFTLEAPSVMKKMKDKAFARGCNREDIKKGAEEIGIELAQHVSNIIAALRVKATELGIAGNNSAQVAV